MYVLHMYLVICTYVHTYVHTSRYIYILNLSLAIVQMLCFVGLIVYVHTLHYAGSAIANVGNLKFKITIY